MQTQFIQLDIIIRRKQLKYRQFLTESIATAVNSLSVHIGARAVGIVDRSVNFIVATVFRHCCKESEYKFEGNPSNNRQVLTE